MNEERLLSAIDDLRVFMRESTVRQERVFGAMIERLDAQTRAIEEHRREFVEEMQAQRAAMFKLLDRFPDGPEAAGA